jgi:hypothetical protein
VFLPKIEIKRRIFKEQEFNKRIIITPFFEIDELTAHLSNPTSKVSVGLPRLITRRQDSGDGIVPRNHTPTPGEGAPALKTGV